MLGGKYRTALISRSARLVDASVTVLSAETDGVEALQIARFELAGSTGARGSIASGSSVAMMFSMRAMTSRENGPTWRYKAISATTQRIESGLCYGKSRAVRAGSS